MQFSGKMAVLCLAACASQFPAAAAPAQHQTRPTARQAAPEVRTRDLLLFAAGLILLAGRRRPGHDAWQDPATGLHQQ
ncbi:MULTISPECIES: hypothetical protein [unclassified Janthinobacterium]|uniref:hypothetical protein n=1 Tax=unclassified Janthinobacterium TaxID=2610881 RepID=UPI001113BD3E|nr:MULTISPECIES: hypothetical protein [unclassified Janthinobacterium]